MKKQITLVGNPELSKKVQEAAFKVGYTWEPGHKVPHVIDQPFLLFDADGIITWDNRIAPADCQLEILQPCDIIADPSILCGAKKPEEVPPVGYRLVTDEEHKTCWKPGVYAWFCRAASEWELRDMSARTKNVHMLPGRTYALPVDCELELIKKPEPEPTFPMFIKVESKAQYDRIQLLCREPDFQPEKGEEYWCCGDNYGPEDYAWEGDSSDKYNYATGNVFRTEKDAQAHLNAVMKLWK